LPTPPTPDAAPPHPPPGPALIPIAPDILLDPKWLSLTGMFGFPQTWPLDPDVKAPNMIGEVVGRRVILTANRPDLGVTLQRTLPEPGLNVGLLWAADNNSPQPRDRVFAVFDYSSRVPLSTTGSEVDRLVFGFEKTLFEQRASLEVRIPAAETVRTDFLSTDGGLDARDFELGDIFVALKVLFCKTETLDFAGGVAMILPTGSDVSLRDPTSGAEVLRLEGAAIHFQPFLAAAWAPNDRFFLQSFLQFDFESTGNSLSATSALSDVTQFPTNFAESLATNRLGSETSPGLMRWDVQAGWWCYRCPEGRWVTAVAPLAELHYSAGLGDPQPFSVAGISAQAAPGTDRLSLTLGVDVDVCAHASVLAGFTAPLLGRDKRDNDFNFSLMVNYHLESLTRWLHSTNY
jgi:hypothetical protein